MEELLIWFKIQVKEFSTKYHIISNIITFEGGSKLVVGIGRTWNLYISFTTHENVVVNYSMEESIVFPFIPWHYYIFRAILVRVYHKFNVVWLLHFMGGKQFQFIKQLYRKCQWYSLPNMSSSVQNSNHVIIISGNWLFNPNVFFDIFGFYCLLVTS